MYCIYIVMLSKINWLYGFLCYMAVSYVRAAHMIENMIMIVIHQTSLPLGKVPAVWKRARL
jgi:hypothetical protein